MNIGFLAHDAKKTLMHNFCIRYKDIFKEHELFATGTTGNLIENIAELKVHTLLAGAMGGEHQLAAMVEANEIDIVFLFRDPTIVHTSENGYTKLYEACDLHNVPLATNIATAEILVKAIENSDLNK